MSKTSFDFSHLNVDERVQLAEDLWDSLADMQEGFPLTAAQAEELDRRREAYRQDRDPGIPWMEALREIEKPGA
ncbi:MAG TPA: addiction module protein [Thermoanaerobaculia bacterium]|nr:addiction module protein [Thermoanaerobaculia bacterium]